MARDRLGFCLRSVTGMGVARLSLRAGGWFHVRRVWGRGQGTVTAGGVARVRPLPAGRC